MKAYYCKHLVPHVIEPTTDPIEAMFRIYMIQGGWTETGYCFSYYPEWLRMNFNKMLERVGFDPEWRENGKDGKKSKRGRGNKIPSRRQLGSRVRPKRSGRGSAMAQEKGG